MTEDTTLDPRTQAGQDQDVLAFIAWASLIHVPLTLITNGAVMVIIYQVRSLKTPYNYFLFSLALADAMTSVVCVLWVVDFYGDRTNLKRHFEGCIFGIASSVFIIMSQLSCLMWVCVDRFLQVNFPFWYKANIRNSTSVWISIVTLLVELTMSYGVLSFILPYDKDEPDLAVRCNLGNVAFWYGKVYLGLNMFTQITIMICLIAQVSFVALRKARIRKKQLHAAQRADKETQEQIRSIKMMIILMFLFLLFWIPLLIGFATTEKTERNLYFSISLFWIKFNSSINAFVYSFSKGTFKHGFRYIRTHRPCAWKKLNRYLTNKNRTTAGSRVTTTDRKNRTNMYCSTQAPSEQSSKRTSLTSLDVSKTKNQSVTSKAIITKSCVDTVRAKPKAEWNKSATLLAKPSVEEKKSSSTKPSEQDTTSVNVLTKPSLMDTFFEQR